MYLDNFDIEKTNISRASPPYVIAEIGSNYDQNLEQAKKMINIAKESGASAVKFQLFSADELYRPSDPLYKIFKENELNQDHAFKIKEFCDEEDVTFLCSCFDMKSFLFLEEIKVVGHKIASSELTNLELVYEILKTKKPVFVSTGMSELSEISIVMEMARELDSKQIALFQCSSQYPLKANDANLNFIRTLASLYKVPVGFSDHSISNVQAQVALGIGATIFEKHFTLDKSAKGPDHFYALEPDELRNYINFLNEGFVSLGNGQKSLLDSEKSEGRRDGLYFSKNLKSGEILKKSDLDILRPRKGIDSRFLNIFVGKKLKKSVNKGEPARWDLF